MVKPTFPPASANRLLALLPVADYDRLHPFLHTVTLETGTILQPAHAPVEWAYFPVTCIASSLVVMEDGTAIEVGTVGREGVVGAAPAVLGVPVTSRHRVVTQVPGEALRVPAATLEREAGRSPALRRVLAYHQAAVQTQSSQSVACNGLHPVGQRCCRWLLATHDRVGGDDLRLTHEYLAVMLGVRRSSVTEVLGPLRKRGLLRYGRGAITILDREGLEKAACECYRVVRDEYGRLIG